MIELDFLHHLDKLSLIINKRITSDYAGENKSEYTGRGLVFKDYVIYAPGDDFRGVDWKVYARSEKLFSKRYEEERNLTVHIIVDFSGSMGFGSGRVKKSDYASMAALGFIYMAMKNNERFVLSTFSDKLESFKPKRGRKQLAIMMDYLNAKTPQGLSKFEESLVKYKNLVTTKSFVVIISDFLYDTEEIKRILHRYRKHEIRLVQVLDPMETKLDLDGDYKFKDSETKDVMRTFVSPYLRRTYLQKLDEHKAKISQACDEVGARFYSFSTDYPIFDAFYQILQSKYIRTVG